MSPQRPLSRVGSRPLVYAHRGDRSRAADNTLEAFSLAAEAGADGVEFDVRSTSDRVLVISHDPNLADGTVLAETSFEDLRTTNPAVPTLQETVGAIPPHMFLNLEIKSDVPDGDSGEPGWLVGAALEEVARHDSLDRVLLSSFDPDAVASARNSHPDLACGQLVTSFLPTSEMIDVAVRVGADAVHPPMTALANAPDEAVRSFHDADLAVVVWNANTPQEVRAVAGAGVDVIITDDPAMARRVLGQR